MNAAKEQHKGLCATLLGASVTYTLHTILLEMGGTIYNNHTLEPFKILKGLGNLLPSFMFILSVTLPNLSIPDVPFTTLL